MPYPPVTEEFKKSYSNPEIERFSRQNFYLFKTYIESILKTFYVVAHLV